MTYSGSRYPDVPLEAVVTWDLLPSIGKSLDMPKSDIFASSLSFKRMFVVFKSLWIIGGFRRSCRYSSPEKPFYFNQPTKGNIRINLIKIYIYIYIWVSVHMNCTNKTFFSFNNLLKTNQLTYGALRSNIRYFLLLD